MSTWSGRSGIYSLKPHWGRSVIVQRIAALAFLMVSLDTGVAFGATDSTITYRAKIVVPGDPGLTSEMEQISRLVSKQGQVESEFALRRRAVSDIVRLKAAAQAAGYYDVGLTYDLDTKNRPW